MSRSILYRIQSVKLKDMLHKQSVIANLKAKTRDEVLRELVNALPDNIKLDRERLFEALVDRENQSSTALPGNVAIPHGRLNDLDQLLISFGRHTQGVDFGDQENPSKLFFLLVAPMGAAGGHLKALARIARLCRDQSLRQRLLNAPSPDKIFDEIICEDERHLS